MVLLEKEKIDEILENIKDFDLVHDFRLTTGNCGVFAIALQKLIDDGELWQYGDCAHVVLKVGDTFIDGTGKMDSEALEQAWTCWDKHHWKKDEAGPEYIVNNTNRTLNIEEMTIILQMLASSQVEEAQDFYNRVHHY